MLTRAEEEAEMQATRLAEHYKEEHPDDDRYFVSFIEGDWC